MYERPSTIDIFLSGKPELRAELEAAASDPGMTIDQLLDRMRSVGCQSSRSAAARWRGRFRKHKPGPRSGLREQIIGQILIASPAKLAEVARLLKIA